MDLWFGYTISDNQKASWHDGSRSCKNEYKIVHRKGKTHGNADAMSRMYCNQRRYPIHGARAQAHAIQVKQNNDTGSGTVQLKDSDTGPIKT